ncbi:MAG: LacI family DNA-binding transcriptional regulator [Opitutales bacterium]|nr:LacI family DNA-binding transcriptional regulator [Opitutales bacterium]
MEPITTQPQRVTMQDIAESLGLSKATVCRALLQRARVAPATREKVEAAAKKLGYLPDPTLRALSKHRWAKHAAERSSYRIALVEINSHRTNLKGGTEDPSARGAFARAQELGLEMDSFAFEEYAKPSRLGDVLFHRGYDGILFNIRGPALDWKFPWEKFSCLSISFDHPSHRLHQVCSDWFNAVSVAVEDIRSRGYKRPGFLQFRRENPSIDLRTKAAILLWQEELSAGTSSVPRMFEYLPPPAGDEGGFYVQQRGRFAAWLEEEKPDVVIDGGYFGYWWMKDLGIRVPEDIGYLRLRHSVNAPPDFVNGVDHKLTEQGRWGVDLLFNMIQLNLRGISEQPIRITVKCEPFEGRTLRRLPQKR